MTNVHARTEGHLLILTVDLRQRHGPSKSGKTTTVASSDGNQRVEGYDGIVFGLNVYTPRKGK